MKDGAVVVGKSFLKASHPTQVVRHLVSSTPSGMDFFTILIMSSDGDYWDYVVQKSHHTFLVRSVVKQTLAIPRGIFETLLAGNMSVKEAVAYG